jgi:hypothetical protein
MSGADMTHVVLEKCRHDEANQMFDDGLRKAITKGPDALAEFMSESHADGKFGAVKFKAMPSADGKSWQMHRVADDGSLSPFGGRFESSESGYATAGMMLSRSVPDAAKVAHMLNVHVHWVGRRTET